jgi:threonylcarbamoyladenosine tRNA methylthiotransferase MtaB
MDRVMAEVAAREADGYQEIVLTGVHIGAYGRERGETLTQLVRTILEGSSFPRLRLTSIEPWDVTDDLLDLWGRGRQSLERSERLCRHLHLPLQSGCDATLRRMNRRYTRGQFQRVVERARSRIPDLAVTTDVIVGFPGEDEQDFEDSLTFITAVGFSRIHVFPFSARPGTEAYEMAGRVPPCVMAGRVDRMLELGRCSSQAFRSRWLGCTMDVLWESARDRLWNGLTDNYVRVEVSSQLDLHNRIVPVQVDELTREGLRGNLANS